MDHCSIVCSIIKHAVAGNISSVRDYASLLADKLLIDGSLRQVEMVERAASGLPPSPGQSVSVGTSPIVPVEVIKGFPRLPEYEGSWWPIYWTPIMGSGERITAFIVALGKDNQCCVRQTIKDDALNGMLEPQAAAGIRNLFGMVLSGIESALAGECDFAQWEPSITGFTRGSRRYTLANNIRQIAAQGIRFEAALAEPVLANLNQE